MRIYVEMSYTVAIDVDPESYDTTDRVALAEACATDPELYECFPDDPRPFYEADWKVVTDIDQMKWLDDERAFHQITVEYVASTPENVETSCTCSPYWPKGDPRHVCTCTPENVECPDCQGRGWHTERQGLMNGQFTCLGCNGTGMTPENVECQTCGGDGEFFNDLTGHVTDCPDCTPENVEPLCDACNDTGFVDDLDNDGASVKCEWCPTPENTKEPT